MANFNNNQAETTIVSNITMTATMSDKEVLSNTCAEALKQPQAAAEMLNPAEPQNRGRISESCMNCGGTW